MSIPAASLAKIRSMESLEAAAIVVLFIAAMWVGAVIACYATRVTIAHGIPVQGEKAVLAIAGFGAAPAAIASACASCGACVEDGWRMPEGAAQRMRSCLPLRLAMFLQSHWMSRALPSQRRRAAMSTSGAEV